MSFKSKDNAAAIAVDGLCYSYRKKAPPWTLKGIDLQLNPGDYTLLCGSSGCGKSTLCRSLNGLIPHFYGGSFEGTVRIGPLSTLRQTVGSLLDRVGLVFQNPEAQLFNRTVALELSYGLESLGLAPAEIRRRTEEIGAWLQIEPLLERNPHQLSGGEQHLVAVAVVMALRPDWLVLDEPYANLDGVNAWRIRAALRSIHDLGYGVVVAEHRLTPTVPDSDQMIVLHGGTVASQGPPQQVLRADVGQWGLETPLATLVARELGLQPLPLDSDDLLRRLNQPPAAEPFKPSALPPIPATAAAAVEIQGLSSHRGDRVLLDKIDFNLYQGECLAVVGANGAGKTTLLKHLNGLYRPTEGQVRIGGVDTRRAKVSQMAQHVGIAFQNPNSQFFKLTVRDEIQVGAKVLGCFDDAWFDDLVTMFGLKGLLDRSPHRLSTGEKKRVAFAAALAAKPSVLALDEPTAGQDGHFRQALGRLMARLRDQGRAVILATHDLAFAERHTHRWLVLSGGKQLALGAPVQVMADEKVMAAARLVPTEAYRLFCGRFDRARPTNRYET